MKAEIITIGDEILIGQIVDTNSAWIAARLNEAGFTVVRKLTVGDDRREIADAVEGAMRTADAVIVTGGLGPTKDDITKQTLAGIWQFLRDVRKIRKAHGHIRIKAALHLRHHQRYAIGIGISLRRSHTGPDIRVFPVPMQQVNSGTFRFRHSSPVKGKYHCKSGIHAQRLRTDGAFEKSHKKPPSPKIDRPICRPVAIF